MRVAYLSVKKDLTYEVHQPLDLTGVPDFLLFDDERRADHLCGCSDVEEKQFPFLG